MSRYYTVEKAKYGGVTGTIMPFTYTLPTTNDSFQGNWRKLLPAGFLRCDGSIIKAELYPSLAAVIGLGADGKFVKDETAIEADEFQLPDLGSKYIKAANASGSYQNLLTTDNTASRVGAATEVQSNIGGDEIITYTGQFNLLSDEDIPIDGNPFYKTSTGFTLDATTTEEYFQGHGHDSNIGIFTYLAQWSDTRIIQTNSNGTFTGAGGGNTGQTEGSNNLVQVNQPDESTFAVKHNHQIVVPNATALKANNKFVYNYVPVDIPLDGIETTVTVTAEDNIKKLDEVIAPYIIVEYIIKL